MTTFSFFFNYIFAAGAFALGFVLNTASDIVVQPCVENKFFSWFLQALLTFFFPLILCLVRWWLKDKKANKRTKGN